MKEIEHAVLRQDNDQSTAITKLVINNKLILSTTRGLSKKTNEDRIGYVIVDEFVRVCIADGHWGEEAAEVITSFWSSSTKFPATKGRAVELTKLIENKLYEKFGQQEMDENKDFTPEAGFVVMELSGTNLRVVSYGDCRLLVFRGGELSYELEKRQTWLGAFSYLGIRKRLPVKEGIIFDELELNSGDVIFVFSDGVDECKYEQCVISTDELASISTADSLQIISDEIYKRVYIEGAEDNASLALLKV